MGPFGLGRSKLHIRTKESIASGRLDRFEKFLPGGFIWEDTNMKRLLTS